MIKQSVAKEDVKTLLGLIPKSRIFSVVFIKKDGSTRVMNCRRGVTSYLTPNPTRPRPVMPESQITVFDMQCKQYRQINTETVKEIKACGCDFVVEDK